MDLVLHVFIFLVGGRVHEAADLGQLGGIGAVIIARRRAGAAGVFPLGFSRQAIAFAFALTQPIAERDGVVPAHVEHRMVVGLRKANVAPVVSLLAARADTGGRIV